MHEWGIVKNIIKQIEDIAKSKGFKEIKRVTLEVGMMSGVLPSHLKEHLEALSPGTILDKTEWMIISPDDLSPEVKIKSIEAV